MTLLDFAASYVGRVVTAPGGLGGQCVDLANLYITEVLGKAPVRANAKDWPAFASSMYWVPNGPSNAPSPGALVVWRPKPGVQIDPNGHIALALMADAMHLITLDQNWPDGAPVSLVLHSYRGVAGWLLP